MHTYVTTEIHTSDFEGILYIFTFDFGAFLNIFKNNVNAKNKMLT